MPLAIGYLLPTREQVMQGHPEAAPLLRLAEQAEALGYDSIWVGDSLLARPRHEPLTLLGGVAGRTRRVKLGTAVLLPALRNPVVLAHQISTLDQVSEGRLILGVGIASDNPPIHKEFMAAGVPFAGRVGRMMEGLRLCRALWTGEKVDWDGRWRVQGAVLGPVPYQKNGPPLWYGGTAQAAIARTAKFFDGWFPNHAEPERFATEFAALRAMAAEAGRDPAALDGATYLTLAIDDNAARAEERMNTYMESYYNQPAAAIRGRQVNYAGPTEGVAALLRAYADTGASHLVLRFAGDHDRQMQAVAKIRRNLGW
ncbi:MAG: LLM class flavin-dependent oxidoreductase [Acetobacteraceae bacterium]|nr:LLM class flavin-dependent oxidoreductase [Acetobacteraceae bacterium]